MPVDPMTGEQLPYDDDIDMAAMQQMMGGGMPGGMPGGDAPLDMNGVTEIPVPNFAIPAVLELIEILETEMMGGGSPEGGMPPMGGGMPPMPPGGMSGGMPPMM